MPPPSPQSTRHEEGLLSSITPGESKKFLPAPIPLFEWVYRAPYSFGTAGVSGASSMVSESGRRRNESSRRFPKQSVFSFRGFLEIGTSSKPSLWILNKRLQTTKHEKVRHTKGAFGLARRKNGGREGFEPPDGFLHRLISSQSKPNSLATHVSNTLSRCCQTTCEQITL